MTTQRIELDGGYVEVRVFDDGGVILFRREKYIELDSAQWAALLSMHAHVSEKLSSETDMRVMLGEPSEATAKFVGVERYNDYMYVDLRKWYWGSDKYLPTREGVKLRATEWVSLLDHFKNAIGKISMRSNSSNGRR